MVEAVEELCFEILFRSVENFTLHVLVVLVTTTHRAKSERYLTFDDVGTHVGGEDDDGITEVDLATE